MATSTPTRSAPAADGPPAGPTRSGMRDRLLPRTVLGLSTLMLFTAIGAAFSGAVLFAYYQWRLDQNEAEVAALVTGFDEAVDEARGTIESEREAAKEQVRQEIEPIKKLAASGETLTELVEQVGPSVWFVVTRDEAGQPSVGSAFVAASDAEQSFLLTSYSTVRANTAQPAPGIRVRKGGEELDATLWTWDEGRDLALLVLRKGNQPRLEWAGNGGVSLGDRLFVVSGLGAAGGAVTQGFVADVSATGIQHDAAVGAAFQGGPIVNDAGEVMALASRTYSPLGFAPGDVRFGVPIRESCQAVLRCPGGNAGGAGDRR